MVQWGGGVRPRAHRVTRSEASHSPAAVALLLALALLALDAPLDAAAPRAARPAAVLDEDLDRAGRDFGVQRGVPWTRVPCRKVRLGGI